MLQGSGGALRALNALDSGLSAGNEVHVHGVRSSQLGGRAPVVVSVHAVLARVSEIARDLGVGRDGRYIVARYPAANPNVAKASSAPSTVCHTNQGLALQVSAGVMMWWRQEATRGGDWDWAGSLGPRLVPAPVPFCWWPFWGRACSDGRFPSEHEEGECCRIRRWERYSAECTLPVSTVSVLS